MKAQFHKLVAGLGEVRLNVMRMRTKHQSTFAHVGHLGEIWGSDPASLANPASLLNRVVKSIDPVLEMLSKTDAVSSHVDLWKENYPVDIAESMTIDSRLLIPLFWNFVELLQLDAVNVELPIDGKGRYISHSVKVNEVGLSVSYFSFSDELARPSHEIGATHLGSDQDLKEVSRAISQRLAELAIVGLDISSGSSSRVPKLVANNAPTNSADWFISMSAAEPPDPLVSDEEDKNSLDKLTARINRFAEKGFYRKVILLGKPGTGKTSLAKMIALSRGKLFALIPAVDLGRHDMRAVLKLLGIDTLIIDDFDRDPVDLSELLNRLHLGNPVHLFMTCNTLDGLDQAVLRPGRADEIITVELPSVSLRRKILRLYAPGISETLLDRYIPLTQGMAPADLRELGKCYVALDPEDFEFELKRIQLQREDREGNSIHTPQSNGVSIRRGSN